MRRFLWPLTPLYATAVAAKNAAFDRGWKQVRQLAYSVVSVGNLSVGGSGKTPCVIALAELLTRQGWGVDVLSRGYGRSSSAIERVDPQGSAEQYGDEPLLIAQATDAPVYVGADRYSAGLLAEKDFPEESGRPRLHLLDDGFQHRQLLRAVDIVLVHRDDFRDGLLPAGNLREPLRALRRASALVLRKEDAELEPRLRKRGIEQPVWWIERSIEVPQNVGRVVAFCGIARPGEFFAMLRAQGVDLAATHAFGDHHPYIETDMRQLQRSAREQSAHSFLTTEKDFVRLSQEQRDFLSAEAPLQIVRLKTTFYDEAVVLQKLRNF